MPLRAGLIALTAVSGAVFGVAVALLIGVAGTGLDVGCWVGAAVGLGLCRRWPGSALGVGVSACMLVAARVIPGAPVVGVATIALLAALGVMSRRPPAAASSNALPLRAYLVPAGVVAVVAVVVHSIWSVTRHQRFGSGSWDYGCYVHNAWLFAHGDAFALDARSAVLGDVAFWGGTNHFMPTLVVTAPIAWLMELTGSTALLAVAQVVVVVVAVVPLVIAARHRGVSPLVAMTIAVAFVLHVGTQAALFFDVHEIALVPVLLLSLLCLADAPPDRRRVVAVVALGLLLAGTKESAWLYLCGAGLVLLLRPGWRVVGGAFVVVGVAGFVVVVGGLQPALLEPGSPGMIHAARFVAVDGTGTGIGPALQSWVLHPGRAIGALLAPVEKATTLTTSVLGFGALPLLSPPTILLALPNLVERFLADKREMWGLGYHYGLVTAACLAWGAVDVAGRFARLKIDHRLVAVVVATGLVASFIGSPRRPDLARLEQDYFASAADVARFERALDVVKDSDAVVAQNHLLPHLALRRDIWLPEDRFVDRADVAVLDTAASAWPRRSSDIKRLVAKLRADPRFDVSFNEETTWVFRRR